jgi:hypothetical protein
MTADMRRIRAVAASLRSIRDRVREFDDDETWDTVAFDNAVGLLEGAIEDTDFSGYLLELAEMPARGFLVHLDSLIAFLDVYEKEAEGSGGILNFPSRKG